VTFPAEPHGPSLQVQLDEITAHTRLLVPPERLARTEQLVQDLLGSGIEDHLPATGTVLPPFELKGANGKPVCSGDLLSLGPLVLKFFRGRWDPYDMTELERWQALQSDLRGRRALVVAISPQLPRQNAFTADRHRLSFPVLSDPSCTFAIQCNVAHTVPEDTRAHYRSMLVNIPFLNGDETWRLPIPATIVLDRDGVVVYREGYADHRVRPEPAHAIAALDKIVGGSRKWPAPS
jgi:peroxiredoxin